MTATLRATARTIALCALAMLMTGCIKVDLNMELHGDNTVGGTMVFAVSRDLLALTGSSADDLLGQITASAGPLPSGVQFQESPYADDKFGRGKTYTFHDVPIDAFSQGTTAGETISIKRVGDTFQVNGDLDLTEAATGPLQPGAAQLAKGMELRIAITFPGPVSGQSGGTITGNTVTWMLAFGEKTEIQATGSAIRQRRQRAGDVDPARARDPAGGGGGAGPRAEPAEPGLTRGRNGDGRNPSGARAPRCDGRLAAATAARRLTGPRHRTADSATRSPSTKRDGLERPDVERLAPPPCHELPDSRARRPARASAHGPRTRRSGRGPVRPGPRR